jgi:ribulose bisphosphate carboxylase small subunit
MHRETVVRVAGYDPNGREQLASLIVKLDYVSEHLTVFASAPSYFV